MENTIANGTLYMNTGKVRAAKGISIWLELICGHCYVNVSIMWKIPYGSHSVTRTFNGVGQNLLSKLEMMNTQLLSDIYNEEDDISASLTLWSLCLFRRI